LGQDQVVQQALALIQQEQSQALVDGLNMAYTGGATDQKASDGTFTQADIDAAVKAATDPLNAQIATITAQDQTDQANLAAAQANLASVQQQLAAMTAQDQSDKALVANFQTSVAQLQASLDAIKAALAAILPAPTPST